jgi:hypothetical protein
VFDQQRVWVDFWGNEIALGSMNDDCLVNVLAFVRADASRIRDIAVLNLVTEQLARLAAGAPSEPDVFRHAFSAYDVDAVAWLDQMPLMQALSKLVEKHGRGRRRRGRVAMNRNQAIFNDCGNYCDAISSVARATEMLCTELDLRAAEEIGT